MHKTHTFSSTSGRCRDEDDEGFFEFFLGVLDGVDVGIAFVVDGVGEFGVAVD